MTEQAKLRMMLGPFNVHIYVLMTYIRKHELFHSITRLWAAWYLDLGRCEWDTSAKRSNVLVGEGTGRTWHSPCSTP
jgi:hypothetical protein